MQVIGGMLTLDYVTNCCHYCNALNELVYSMIQFTSNFIKHASLRLVSLGIFMIARTPVCYEVKFRNLKATFCILIIDFKQIHWYTCNPKNETVIFSIFKFSIQACFVQTTKEQVEENKLSHKARGQIQLQIGNCSLIIFFSHDQNFLNSTNWDISHLKFFLQAKIKFD